MKTKIFTICIMVAALAMFAPVAEADFKVTGGGWIPVYDDNEEFIGKASFGLHIKCVSLDPSDTYTCIGNVQYNDRGNNIKFHSTELVLWTFSTDDNFSKAGFIGTGKVNKDENITFRLRVGEDKIEDEDIFEIFITGIPAEGGNLEGGNINIIEY